MASDENPPSQEVENLEPTVVANNQQQKSNDDISFSFDEGEGNQLGRYQLIDKLGQGAFGVVFRARDETLERYVAIKLLTRFQSSSQANAWIQEARVLAKLDHPSIVPVYDVGKTNQGQPFIVSKLIDGGNLSERASRPGWSLDDSVNVITQLALALDYLHRRGVMHRDIKPTNVLTTDSGDAVLVDFGLALPEGAFGQGSRFVGTPAYMSPEQARHEGHRVDGRSDIYSLGVVFYELLTGTRPFVAKDQEELLECIRNVEVRPLRQINASVPKELERICLKALSKKVSDRYATAADMADDLTHWRSVSVEAASFTKPQSHALVTGSANPQETAAPSTSLDIETVGVVPHGLRPFGENDADFFRYLVPGARDRNGIPETISFWVQRIRSRNNDTFRIGVLMGLSGSGKSSLVRAGVLPLLADACRAIFVEAKADTLETDLLTAIHREYPQYGSEKNLRELLIRIRFASSPQRPKLLIVIDQFEQWLNHHREISKTSLHEAMRQCDGVNIQTLLLVRDDFMLGLSQFMDEMDESLLQNHNFATIEPFGVVHGSKVLAAFGRALGTVSQPPTAAQISFIEAAISGLANIGRLEPVQIALLSEMVKNKPWNLGTLKELGGIQGLGIAFLEERLTGTSAHPLLRSHLDAVKRILKELLPTDETIIKPQACAQSVLLERLDGVASNETLSRLLHLIDTEVRLITPSSNPNLSSTSSSQSSARDPAYQLTHDYLVPTIRKWLASQNNSTTAGRAAEQLREMSASWHAKPINKRLPTFVEWATIAWHVPRRDWSASESKLMQTAQRRFLLIGALSFVTITLFLGLLWSWQTDWRAKTLAERLLEARTEDVIPLLEQIKYQQNSVLAKLPRFDSRSNSDSLDDLQRFRVALVSMKSEPAATDYVLGRLSLIEDRFSGPYLAYLANQSTLSNEDLLLKTRDALERRLPESIALAALLCQRSPHNQEWETLSQPLCEALSEKPTSQLPYWIEHFRPIASMILEKVNRMALAPKKSSGFAGGQTRQSLAVIVSMLADEPKTLAGAMAWLPQDSIGVLLDRFRSSKELAIEFRQSLSTIVQSDIPRRLDTKSTQAIESSFGGQVFDRGGWLERVPLSEVERCLDELSQLNLGIASMRPYPFQDKWFVAITLLPSQSEQIVSFELDETEFQSQFEQKQSAGWALVDFASYMPEGATANPKPVAENPASKWSWCAVWRKEPELANRQVLFLGETDVDMAMQKRLDRVAGLIQTRHDARLLTNGRLVYDSLWSLASDSSDEQVRWSRLQFAAGDLYPGYLQTDLRATYTFDMLDRSRNWSDFYNYELGALRLQRESPVDTVLMASRLSACGELADALQRLDQIEEKDWNTVRESERPSRKRTFYRTKGRTLAKLGKSDELRTFIETLAKDGLLPPRDLEHLALRLAVLDANPATIEEALDKLEKSQAKSTAEWDILLRSLGTIASQDAIPELAARAFQKLEFMATQIAKSDRSLLDAFLDSDFDELRTRREWIKLMNALQLGSRYTACHHASALWESKLMIGLSPIAHSQSVSQRLAEGYLPSIWQIHKEPYEDSVISSVWMKPKMALSSRSEQADQIATLALSLARLGESDVLIDAINGRWGRTVQSSILSSAPKLVPSSAIVGFIRSSTDPAAQVTLLSILTNYKPTDLSEPDLRYVQLRIQDWLATSNEASLRNMAQYAAAHLQAVSLPLSTHPIAGANWEVNSIGQQFIEITPKNLVLVGEGVKQMWTKIGRKFSISSTEVTGDQFAEFYEDLRFQRWVAEKRQRRWCPLMRGQKPQHAVSWNVAILYCQWLNERERIPESEWCYENVWGENDMAPRPKPGYLSRKGYRLPTIAEWTYACAAGSSSYWHFGDNEQHTSFFEWHERNSDGTSQNVARLRPNAFGLFDMGGNLAEWTDTHYRQPLRPLDNWFTDDHENLVGDDKVVYCILAGGRFKMSPMSVGSQSTTVNAPEYSTISTGFRIARTIQTIE